MSHAAQILLSELDSSAHAARERELLPRLAPGEQARYRGFGADARRRTWLAGRELLCAAVARALGEVDAAALLTQDGGGVCYVAGELHVNLSHSGGWLAAASAAVPVGIDIERVRPRAVTTQASRVFCASEAQALEQDADPLTGFYRLWTLKEAACKAVGLTVWDSLQHVCFDLEAARCRLSPPFPAGDWCFLHGSFAPGWRLALALHGTTDMTQTACWRRSGDVWDRLELSELAHIGAPRADAL